MTTDDVRLLRAAAREALAELSPSAVVRRQMDSGWDAGLWRRLCRELGIAGLMVPEEFGGAGLSAVEQGVVFEEAGRRMLCGPLLSTAGLAIPVLLLSDDAAARERLLPDFCSGERAAAVVTVDRHAIRATANDGGYVLDGAVAHVLDGLAADVIFVPAVQGGVLGVYVVDAEAPGLTRTPLISLDQTRPQAALNFQAVRAVPLVTADAERVFEDALAVGQAMLACEQAGGAAACLDGLVEYAKTRVQFGRAIGSFQAVKQKAADLLVKVESSKSAAAAAACAAAEHLAARGIGAPTTDDGPLSSVPELSITASVAQAYCSEAFVTAAAENIQLHGGIGFTWEHDAHLYFKRAWTSRELLGRPEEHLESLAHHLAAAT